MARSRVLALADASKSAFSLAASAGLEKQVAMASSSRDWSSMVKHCLEVDAPFPIQQFYCEVAVISSTQFSSADPFQQIVQQI